MSGLLTASGQPCPDAIEAEAQRRLYAAPWPGAAFWQARLQFHRDRIRTEIEGARIAAERAQSDVQSEAA